MSEHRSARPAHRLQTARHHLDEARRELQQACDLAQTGGGQRQLEAVLAHLRHLEELMDDAERHLPQEQGPPVGDEEGRA